MRVSAYRFLPLCLALAAPAAGAHAFLDHAEPAVGGAVAESPRVIRLWFTEDVEPKFSKIELSEAAGGRIAAGPVSIGPNDRSELDLPVSGALPPGVYKVSWRVVSTDTHQTEGDFTFEVRP